MTNSINSKPRFKQYSAEEKKQWLESKIEEDRKIQDANMQELQDFFIEGIEKILLNPETSAWQKSWVSVLNPDSASFPEKFSNSHQYGYNNGLKLLIAAHKAGYIDNRWISLSEARKLGLEFTGDSDLDGVYISRPIVAKGYAQKSIGEKELSPQEKKREYKKLRDLAHKTGKSISKDDVPNTKKVYYNAPVQRFTFFKVFNITLFKGFEASKLMGFQRNEAVFKKPEANSILMYLGAKVRFGFNMAYYRSSTGGRKEEHIDVINMPHINQFSSEEEFFSVFLHEAIHFTGNKARLNRENSEFFQSLTPKKANAFEELVAEIGSALICIKLGISNIGMRENNFKYLASWLKNLNSDSEYIIQAMKYANQAIYYIESTVRSNIQKNIKSDLDEATLEDLSSETLIQQNEFPTLTNLEPSFT